MEKKTGGSFRITYEMMKDILGLPVQANIVHLHGDSSRDIFNVKYTFPGEVKGFSYPIGEGQEWPTIDPSNYLMKRMIRFARQYEKLREEDSRVGTWIQALEKEVIEEEQRDAEIRK
jgi:hypothetical protein